MTLVSIITPSYNQAPFLESTLRSVLEQDYPAIEYIVVDGASQDDSPGIIQRYASRLAWWVSEPDGGQAEAINKGLRKARGEVVAWLNSDDLYLPGAVRSAVSALEADATLGMVYGDAITIDGQGRPLNQLPVGDWGLEELMRFRILCQPAVFMRRDALEQVGYLDTTYHFMLDHHLWLRIAAQAPIRHIPSLWAAARHHPGAKNVAQASGFGREIFRIVEWMQTQPVLGARLAVDRRRVLGGAYRLKARYLQDGGQPGPALLAYSGSLLATPIFALQHKHRMAYAVLCLIGLKGLGDRLVSSRRPRRPDLEVARYQDWPGIKP